MSRISKKEEFHIPFIKNLAFIGLVTIVSMISVRYFLSFTLKTHQNTPIIQYTESQIKPD
jgi:hypothetical protein